MTAQPNMTQTDMQDAFASGLAFSAKNKRVYAKLVDGEKDGELRASIFLDGDVFATSIADISFMAKGQDSVAQAMKLLANQLWPLHCDLEDSLASVSHDDAPREDLVQALISAERDAAIAREELRQEVDRHRHTI